MNNVDRKVMEAVMTIPWATHKIHKDSEGNDVEDIELGRRERDAIVQVAIDAKAIEKESILPTCSRCRNHFEAEELHHHDYWPTYNLCQHCIYVLLEIGFAPFIPIESKEKWIYLCKNEADWHLIKKNNVSNETLEKLDSENKFYIDVS
jgi:hypothetical protein